MDEALRQMKDMAKKALAKTHGTIAVSGLKEEVRILRDTWGVPHIYAAGPEDLFLALGYTHAQERMWQMEFSKRLACGTLSEIIGEPTLEMDIFMRTVGLRRTAQAATALMEKDGDSPTNLLIMAYVQGINAFIEKSAENPAFEFAVLGLRPSTWTLTDTLACSLLLAWQLSLNWSAEILRAGLIEKLGEGRVRELLPSYPAEASLVVPSHGRFEDIATYLTGVQKKIEGLTGSDPQSRGSNNWVIDGTLSATGRPLLANDPHLALSLPSMWYETHLTAPGFNVIGATCPGMPGVIIGHNERIAWGVTTLFADVQDTYIEKINPENPHQYWYQGQWEEAEVCLEQFQLRGKEQPVTKEIRITRHGPIMDSIMLGGAKPKVRKGFQATALRWTGHDPETMRFCLESFIKLNQAENWEDFRKALRLLACPLQNFVYADVEGNIGYQANGLIPIRAKGQGLVPVPGWTGEYEWTGSIPFDEMPSAFNPSQHFIATANNKIVHEDYPYFISHDWHPSFRVRRIVQLLRVRNKHSIEDFMAMQGDVHSLWAENLAPYITRLKAQNPLQSQALDYLRSWDFRMDKDSIATAIFQLWYQRLVENILSDKLGQDLFEQYFQRPLGLNGHHFLALPQLLEYHDRYWFGRGSGSNVESRDRLCLLSPEQAIEELSAVMGPDMAKWRWGRVHTARFRHPLGLTSTLDQVLNAGTAALGGDETTVNLAAFDRNAWPRQVVTIPSYRQIIDLGDFSKSVTMHVPGQSGQPASPHYKDLVTPWAEVSYHPMLFDKDAIEWETKELLKLKPQKEMKR